MCAYIDLYLYIKIAVNFIGAHDNIQSTWTQTFFGEHQGAHLIVSSFYMVFCNCKAAVFVFTFECNAQRSGLACLSTIMSEVIWIYDENRYLEFA